VQWMPVTCRTELIGTEDNSLRPVVRLARAGRLWNVLTMRSEYIAAVPSLARAKQEAERWHKRQVKAMASAVRVRQCQRPPEEPQRP